MSKLLPMLDPFDEIKTLYFSTTRETIDRDLARAMELLARMPDDEARQRAAGLMHGLSDLKHEWKGKRKKARRQGQGTRDKDEGRGTKDKGRGTRDQGRGTNPRPEG